jgi:hypothetical protein
MTHRRTSSAEPTRAGLRLPRPIRLTMRRSVQGSVLSVVVPNMKSLGLEAPPLERRLAAILAPDVEGYSRLMHGDEEATLATLSAARPSTRSSCGIRAGSRTPPVTACSPNLQVCLTRFIARSRSRRRSREQTGGRSRRAANALSDRHQCR